MAWKFVVRAWPLRGAAALLCNTPRLSSFIDTSECTTMSWVVLVAGGHGSGKGEIAEKIKCAVEKLCKEQHLELTCSILPLSDYTSSTTSPEYTDFDKVLRELGAKDCGTPVGDSAQGIQGAQGKNDPRDEINGKDQRNERLEKNAKEPREPKDVNDENAIGKPFPPQRVFIVCGNYALVNPQLRKLAIMRIFVDLDADTRLSRLVLSHTDKLTDHKDQITELRRVVEKYLNSQRAEMEQHILPTREYADVILSTVGDRVDTGVQVVATGICDRIRGESLQDVGSDTGSIQVRPKRYSFRQEALDIERQRFYDVE